MDKKMLDRINELAKKRKRNRDLPRLRQKSRKSCTKFISVKSAHSSTQHLTM